MIASGTLIADDGNQVAVFPSQDLRLTQGTNTSYSHTNTKNTDNASLTGRKKLYAPCDMKIYSNQGSGGYGIIIYHSINPVHTAGHGLTHITLVLMHDNNAQVWGGKGSVYPQGSHFYNEGDKDASGLTTGVHVHYEVALGHQTVRSKGTGSNDNFEISNSVYLDDVFYINMTDVITPDAPDGDHRYSWKTFEGGISPDPVDPDKKQSDILTLMITRALPDFM